eukprot:CAMPEP_0194073736 /NCGR_PEP_ID=MMETSP0149-20130528/1033_1 /TAXON_ID=122233 /ORGANISM="Chaetoceros debilis, Strain MM31A-1" /LENGTH=917 /DNA_ID=CAMNT_0038753779 /DNA_START=273 /DNA_END=3026 /DNA_ORIENTATION=+
MKKLLHQITHQNPSWSAVGEHWRIPSNSQMFSSQNIVSQKEQISKANDVWGHLRYGSGDISHEFYITMINVLRRTNLNSMAVNMFKNTSGSYGGSSESEPSSFGGNMAIQYRHFSTSPPSPAGKDDEISASKTITSKSTMTSDTTSSPVAAKAVTKSDSSFDKAQDMLTSAISTLVSFLMKIPGVTWFYLTHPKEFKDKLSELKEAAKKEAHHYYMGTKLLIADLRTARQMLGRTLQGSSLTRRERKQLLRTVTDVFRLVPMSIFVLIPFMEFALPFALKLFPNMLPSTFQDSLKAEENMKRELKSRLAMAEFFQETLHGLAKEQKQRAELKKQKLVDAGSSDLESTENREETAASFLEFIEKARNGEFLPPKVVIRYAKYFQDELTLDNMHRMQLINMCKYMALPPYGNDNLLRFQLRHKIRTLLEDDQRILWEGITSLTKMELREACQERGMRSTGLSKESYKRALQQWIDLSVNRNVPISLLIMSRTFFLQEEITSTTKRADGDTSKSVTGLADAISGFDKEVVNEVILESVTKDQNDPELTKLKLEVLEQQNELIQEENQQREAEAAKLEAMKAEKEKSESAKLLEDHDEGTEVISPTAAAGSEDTGVAPAETDLKILIPEEEFSSRGNEEKYKSKVIDQFDDISDTKEEAEDEEDASLSSEEIDAISQLVSPDPVSAEREKLASIKAALQDSDVVEDDENKESFPADDELRGKEVSKDYETSNISSESNDKIAEEQIDTLDKEAQASFDTSSRISFDGEIDESEKIDEKPSSYPIEDDTREDRLDVAVTRLKSKVESMVGKIEIKMSDIEAKIGDKMHMLDKDKDGILSQEEMALTLQSVLKRPLTFDEAMAIAADMDENEDGLFTLEELSKWLETNKIVKLVEEGRDAEVDKIVAAKRAKMKENKEDNIEI